MVEEFTLQGMPQCLLVMHQQALRQGGGTCILQELQLATIPWADKTWLCHHRKEVGVMTLTIPLSITRVAPAFLFCFMIINIIQST